MEFNWLVGCFGLLGGSTCLLLSSVPSSFFGFGPGLIACRALFEENLSGYTEYLMNLVALTL